MDIALLPQEPSYFLPAQLDRMLIHAYKQGASDITVQTGEAIFVEVNGRQYRITHRPLTLQECSDIINHIYGPNATALINSGTDIDTNYRVKLSEAEQFRFRVNITACYFDGYQGIQVTMRTISSEPPPLEKMELEPEIKDYLNIPQGILVVSGATGSGKSTLLSAIIGDFCRQKDSNLKILTYESPIEYVYDRIEKPSSVVSQTEIPRYLPTFAAGVRNALRRKPGLILVGEARDKETIEAVIDAALTGHPVYTTVHANGVADTLRRMVTIFPHAEREARMFDLLETTKVILWQALVARPDGSRQAVREYLIITSEVRDLLLGTQPDQLVSKIRRLIDDYGKSIFRDVKQKYEQGLVAESAYKRFELMEQKHYG